MLPLLNRRRGIDCGKVTKNAGVNGHKPSNLQSTHLAPVISINVIVINQKCAVIRARLCYQAAVSSNTKFPCMPTVSVIAIIALVVSITSLGLSSYLAWRDRSRLLAESFARAHERTGEYSSVFITVTNAGRRPLTLRFLSGVYSDGSRGGQRLSEGGVKLEEGEFYELEFGKYDGIMVNGDAMSELVDVFLEDSAGRRHNIKNSRKNVVLVRQSKHPLGVRTHG